MTLSSLPAGVAVVRAWKNPGAVPGAWQRAAFALFLLLALVLPFVLENYTIYTLALVGALAMAILGVNLLTGLSGQFSIGHGAFFAIGAYSTAIAMNHGGLSAYSALPVAAVVSFVSGFLFGWPALRLGLMHLILLTWGFSLVLPQVLKHEVFQDWTGGVSGVYLDRPDPPAWLGLNDDQYWYFITLAIMVLFFWIAGNLINSRSGRALAAIRDNEIAAAPMGINVAMFKTTVFGISAMYAGIGGALTGLLADFVAPDSYGLFFSILLLIGAVTAGFRSVWGALIGSLLVVYLPAAAGNLSASVAVPPFGFAVLLVIYFMPDGISGLAMRTYRRFANSQKHG
ncbi:MAG: branched-chain amino acid ABC transporter permease [Alphaproteobacteria bacterium]|nr:branched-chain amino acid ABC transporter permease [Alphaproteobacteria bacterium]MBL6951996.1 branched-chain amino acid ABC transporter permease [Alphaproteobacteria bacterium]